MTQSIAKNELKTPSIVKRAHKAKVALETPWYAGDVILTFTIRKEAYPLKLLRLFI